MADAPGSAIGRSALAGADLPAAVDVADLLQAPPNMRLLLRVGPVAAAILGAVLGDALGGRPNTARAIGAGEMTALRLGPDEWLIVGRRDAGAALARRIEAAASGSPLSLVEVSHGFVGLLLSGPRVEDVLAAGCPLPLHAAAFPVGRATRTLLGKAGVVLWRQAPDRFRIEVARSFAPYVVAFLAEAITTEAALAATPE
jgi:sarcosine oxidase subunit gamma